MRYLVHILLLATVASGCALTRHVPEGESLYTGAKLEIGTSDQEIDTRQLNRRAEALLRNPAPNRRFLGIAWGLRFYNLFYTKKEKGLFASLQKKLGEAPVLFDEQASRQTNRLLEDLSFNEGFFFAQANSEIRSKDKKVALTYQLHVGQAYRIAACLNKIADSTIHTKIEQMASASLVRPGNTYQLSRLKDERERIALSLRDQGHYFFQADFLKFRADTSLGNRRVRLELLLKPEVPPEELKLQILHQVWVYPDFQFNRDQAQVQDTVPQDNFTLVYKEGQVRSSALEKAILLEPNKLYDPDDHRNTLRRLSLLPLFSFIDIQYQRVPESDSLLEAHIYVSPKDKYNVEGALGLSLRSNAFIGPEFSVELSDRNFRNLAEQLRLKAYGNFNIPLTDAFESYQKVGLSSRVVRQGLVIPFWDRSFPDDLVGQTLIGMDLTREQIRLPLKGLREDLESQELAGLLQMLDADSTLAPFARIHRFDISYGLQWTRRPAIVQEFIPLQITLQDAGYEEEEMQDLFQSRETLTSARSSFLNLERMLLFKPSYTFTYDSRLRQVRRNNFFNRSRVGLSGNLLLNSANILELNNLQALFLQLENDGRYYFRPYDRQTFAFRLASNIAVPFRPNSVLPFIDLYNVGGANSIRAFPPRQLGPGSVEPTAETFFLSSNGDMKLESSVEWRQKLSNFLELALFVDAGNVWNLQGGADKNPASVFQWGQFYRQIAVGTGVGIRFDLEVLLLRLDFAIPLSIPWLPEGQRWVGNQIDFGDPSWRKDNLNFSLAFGYPF